MLCSGMIQSRQIEAFRAVMMTGAMTAAAQVIHVTQPAVSRLIRDLEAELGFALFDRRGNLVEPTVRARALLEEVERSFVGLQRIRDYADDLREGRGVSLRIGGLPAMATFLPRFVARFARDRPNLRVYLDSLHSGGVREQVSSGQLDIGITAAPFKTPGLTMALLEDKAVVAIPSGHSLAAKARIGVSDLEGEDLVLLSKFSENTRHPVELALQAIRRGRVMDTPLSITACALASEGAGIAIVDPFGASDFVGRGLVLRPFEPATAVGVAVIHSSERALSAIAHEFRAAFLAHAQEFLSRADYLGFCSA